MANHEPDIALSEPSADEIKTTTCYMCACRCGIRVHLKDGRVRYIDGNRDHPVNKGVICGKGAAGIMTHTSPSRLRAPLKRVGPRGSGEFEEISWDEALDTATGWLKEVRGRDPSKLAFFTGRDQSQALTGWFAQQYGTQNFAAHGGFCSVNMAAAGLYTFGGSFWEFGEPDWEHTKYFMLFGVAEDHASNPLKIELGKLKAKGVKIVAVNPIRTGYGAIADEWIGIRPGTDGLFVGALIHELMRAQKIDLEYLVRFTNAHWLVIDDPGAADDGLFARDDDGKPLAFDKTQRRARRRGAHRHRAGAGRHVQAGRRPQRAAELRADRRAVSDRRIQPGQGRGGDRDPGRDDPAHRPRAGARRVRAAGHARHPVDRHRRPPPRQNRRPAGVDARHARHLGPFQRLPDLPDAAPAANPAGLDRLPRRLSLQGAVPAADAAAEPAGAADRTGRAAEGRAARLSAGAGGSAGRRRRHAAAHRQGLFVGRAARRAWPDAHGHHQRGDMPTLIRSTCCSCTWPT